MHAPFYQPKIENYTMIACEKKLKVLPPYKIVVVRTCILNS